MIVTMTACLLTMIALVARKQQALALSTGCAGKNHLRTVLKASTRKGHDENNARPPEETLSGSLHDFRELRGPDLLSRTGDFDRWRELRVAHKLWPYARSIERAPKPICDIRDSTGRLFQGGVNFASQDYLGLASHPAIKEVAKTTIEACGVHSAGSAALLGNTRSSLALAKSISELVGMEHTLLFPTGWAAGYGVIRGLVRAPDHVVLDIFTHNCLQEGARAAGGKIHVYRHLDLESLGKLLTRIRRDDPDNGILVVTESLFSMDSDTPDIAAMQSLCNEFNATLLVDVAHDLGNLGEDGTGHLGMQGMLGKVDMVMGSFSKTFSSNGGFVSCNSSEVKEYLQYYSCSSTFSNAMSPVQAATVLKAVDIAKSDEGDRLRLSLLKNVQYLRSELERVPGLEVLGVPSAIVAVKVGDSMALARMVSEKLSSRGAIANLVEYPAVAKDSTRFRLQVMAGHTKADVDEFVTHLESALKEASLEYESYRRSEEE